MAFYRIVKYDRYLLRGVYNVIFNKGKMAHSIQKYSTVPKRLLWLLFFRCINEDSLLNIKGHWTVVSKTPTNLELLDHTLALPSTLLVAVVKSLSLSLSPSNCSTERIVLAYLQGCCEVYNNQTKHMNIHKHYVNVKCN